MKSKPILFKPEMVRAIINGRKTQTRRVVKPPPFDLPQNRKPNKDGSYSALILPDVAVIEIKCPYGQLNDMLWVRETWQAGNTPDGPAIAYRADKEIYCLPQEDDGFCYEKYPSHLWSIGYWLPDVIESDGPWRPSIFMPKWASRIWLQVRDVKIEMVQNITGEEAIAEGWPKDLEIFPSMNAKDKAQQWFRNLWDQINGKKHPWDSNPWVWVITFKRIPKPWMTS